MAQACKAASVTNSTHGCRSLFVASKSLAQYLQARVWTKCFPKALARSERLQFRILICLPVSLTTLGSRPFRPGRNDSCRDQENSSSLQTSWSLDSVAWPA